MTHPDLEWLPVLGELRQKSVPCVLVTVLEAKGSTPREAGTKMVVTADKIFGTIGGGNLEYEAAEQARKILDSPDPSPQKQEYALGPKLSQCCGGAVSILLEPFTQTAKTLYLFGAGHVGKAIIRALEGLPILIKWIDERSEEFPAELPANCQKIITESPRDVLKNAPVGCYILIMTHQHPQDLKITRAAFAHGRFAYLGLIGSKTKRARFEKYLTEDGVDPYELSRLVCPIGIDGITGKHPREIAIAVAAELLQNGITRPSE